MSDRAQTRLIRVLVVAIGALSYYLAVATDVSLVILLLMAYGFLAQLFPVLAATFFWPRSTPAGVIAGLLAGCVVTIVWNLVPSLQWLGIHPGIWGLLANVPTLVVVSLATPPMDAAHIDEFVVS